MTIICQNLKGVFMMPRKKMLLAPLFFIITLMVLLYVHPPEIAYAESNKVAEVNEKTGELTFTLTAKKAGNGVSTVWRTVGFYVTKDPTGHKGKKDTTSSECVFFSNMPKGSKVDSYTQKGLVYTTFTIPKDKFLEMCDKAGVKYDSLQKSGGKVYLQGVLQGYHVDNKHNKASAITERCYTLPKMQNTRNRRTVNGHTWSGIPWPGTCDNGWRQRYDIEVTYVPSESPLTINYYQWYNNKWNLVASLANCKEGQIEKSSSGGTFTRNINSGSGSSNQWQNKTTGKGSIMQGNGLGLAGNDSKKSNGLYYYGRKPISTSYLSIPSKLSSVLPTGSPYTKGDLSKYYLIRTKESKINSKWVNGARVSAKGSTIASYTGKKIVDSSGAYTQSYLNWLPKARQDFDVLSGHTIINVYYQKQSSDKKPLHDEDTISDSHLVPSVASAVIQADVRDNEKFDSIKGIPTSEKQYVNVMADDFLYSYTFTRIHEKNEFQQYISCSHSKTDPKTGKVTYQHDHDTKPVTREYSYWKVSDLIVYEIDAAEVDNYSLPNETAFKAGR